MQTVVKKLFCDVAVIGGGVGGCSAALTASRRGLQTMIFEKGVSLGGLATNGFVPQVAGMIEGNCQEFVDRLAAVDRLRVHSEIDKHNPSFDPEWGKIVLENMLMENGVRIIYDATCIDVEMEDKKVKCAVFFTKGGYMAVYADYFIDATGDADLCAMAGARYQVGGQDFCGLNMSTTLGSRWRGYNKPKYEEANAKFRQEQLDAGKEPKDVLPLIYALEEEAIKNGELARHVANRFNGIFQVRLPHCEDNDIEFCTFSFHSYFTRNTDVEDISRQVIEQRQLMQQFETFARRHVPGYENIRIVGTGGLPGVRDSRRIFGEYMLKASDIACGVKFEDGIARFPEMFDAHHPTSSELVFMRHVHIPAPGGTAVCRDPQCTAQMHPFGRPAGIEARPSPRDYCEIPYRSLLPKGLDNILAVGRCCSAEFHANGAMRIIGPAMGTGQAAGVAVAMAFYAGVRPADIDGKEVRRVLIEEEKVSLDKFPEGWWSILRDQPGEFRVNWGDFIAIVPPEENK
ncbi:MAG: FAD-dependent oxidoreductase [Oscillospiraceae bacterium]|nr:FAD-dependent oxidoreductase [Oscillospiraceae bacterium]